LETAIVDPVLEMLAIVCIQMDGLDNFTISAITSFANSGKLNFHRPKALCMFLQVYN
jgi:hypothetical protein